MPIDTAVLDELERLEKAATPGPLYLEAYNESGPVKVTNGVRWQRAREDGGGVKLKVEVCRVSEQYGDVERSKQIANGELIVAMWNALPDLIAALRESQANDRRYRRVREMLMRQQRVWFVPDDLKLRIDDGDIDAFDAAIDKLDAATEVEHG